MQIPSVPPTRRRFFLPPRNVVVAAMPTALTVGYLTREVTAWISAAITAASLIVVLIVVLVVSTRTNKSGKSLFWFGYFRLTSSQQTMLPLRLIALSMLIICSSAIIVHATGALSDATAYGGRWLSSFVERDLYWSVLAFFGASDSDIEIATRGGRLIYVATTVLGLTFWAVVISVLVSKAIVLTQRVDPAERPHIGNRRRKQKGR
ncbi:MAG: hypothetical protein AB7Q42_13830 [Acidimicrobiia bacterium]